MTILITTDVIHAGGAETFVLRLSEALIRKGHKVILYILYKNKVDQKLIDTIAPSVQVMNGRLKATRLLQMIDSLLLSTKIDFSIINRLLSAHLKEIIKKDGVDIVHSHLFTADQIATAAVQGLSVPVVSTMHGDYTLLWDKVAQGTPVRFLNYKKKMLQVLSQLAGVVCISEQQEQFFRSFKAQLPYLHFQKIYNGYALANRQKELSRAELSLPEKAFVWGMVARGIPEKGWQVVIDVFIRLGDSNSFLLLVGDSDYVQELKYRYSTHVNIRFLGYSKNPVEYIRLFDVALFASTYGAESLPTVLMEYMACGVPVIATDIAECRAMLQAGDNNAGLLVPVQEGKVNGEAFMSAMSTLLHNREAREALRQASLAAFTKFDMDHCVRQYTQLYKEVVS